MLSLRQKSANQLFFGSAQWSRTLLLIKLPWVRPHMLFLLQSVRLSKFLVGWDLGAGQRPTECDSSFLTLVYQVSGRFQAEFS